MCEAERVTGVLVCVHVPTAGVISTTVFKQFSYNIYFTQGLAAHVLHADASRGMWMETRDCMETHEGQPVSESRTQTELWPFNCHD